MIDYLFFYLILYTVISAGQKYLSWMNFRYASCSQRQSQIKESLDISDEDLAKSYAYFSHKYKFGLIQDVFTFAVSIAFLACGGITFVEAGALDLAGLISGGDVIIGMFFFLILWLGTFLIGLPFRYYYTFILEEKYGFNNSTKKLFWIDTVKGIAVMLPILGLFFCGLLTILHNIHHWWWMAWLSYSAFMLLMIWFYPTFISPLFNKFTLITSDGNEKELHSKISEIAKKVDFPLTEIFKINSSIRSTHGNAYFIGMFKKKKIVFYDTLLKALSIPQIVAVLAHELGHFKLHHIRNRQLKSLVLSGVFFAGAWFVVRGDSLAMSFGFAGSSAYAMMFFILVLSSSIIGPLMPPITNYFSQKDEFAADEFATNLTPTEDLCQALKTLRAMNYSMPIVHPLYSRLYYSHPPILARVQRMKQIQKTQKSGSLQASGDLAATSS